MKGKQLRTFLVDGKEVIFYVEHFRDLFIKFAAQKGTGIGNYEYEVAQALFVDRSAVHNWRMGVNGPGDLDKIHLLADLWHIKLESLLTEVKSMSTTKREQVFTEREKIALKKVYTAFIEYMEAFEKSVGFIWDESGQSFNMYEAYGLFHSMKKALKLEYIDLKPTVYDALMKLYDTDLTYTLEGYYNEEEGDCPEMQMDMATDIYNDIVGKFQQIIDPFLG